MTETPAEYGAPKFLLYLDMLAAAKVAYTHHLDNHCLCPHGHPRSEVCTLILRSIRTRMEVTLDLIKREVPDFSLDKDTLSRFNLLP